jgi:hypothetical protein
MLPKTVTTSELCKLSGYTKSSITALQQAGVIERVGPERSSPIYVKGSRSHQTNARSLNGLARNVSK